MKNLFVFLIFLFVFSGCSKKLGVMNYDRCEQPSSTVSVLKTNTAKTKFLAEDYEITYSTYRTNIPGLRHYNTRTLRPNLYSSKTNSSRIIAPHMIDSENSYTSVGFWNQDGERKVILQYRWEDPENAKWEEENNTFRYSTGWKSRDLIADLDNNDAVTDPIGPADQYKFNFGLFFLGNFSGKLAFNALADDKSIAVIMNKDGSAKKQISDGQGFVYGLRASPNAKWIAYHSDYKIIVSEPDGSNPRVAKTPFSFAFNPKWSPDSRYITFVGNPNDKNSVMLLDTERWRLTQLADRGGYSGTAPLLDVYDFHGGGSDLPAWSHDGSWIYFTRRIGEAIEVFRINKDCKLEQITNSGKGIKFEPELSPDGKYLSYISKVQGKRNLMIVSLETFEEFSLTNLAEGHGVVTVRWRPLPPKTPAAKSTKGN